MAQTARTARKRPSTTTQKSSAKPTEKPQSDSQASETESDEISTQTGSSSSPSSEDENDALFEEADQKAAQRTDEAEGEQESDEDADDAPEGQSEAPEDGSVKTFEVSDPNIGTYTFKGVISANTIVVTEDATREFTLPGSKRKGCVLAHHKGQLLPLKPYQRFIKGE